MAKNHHELVDDYLSATRTSRLESFFLEELNNTARGLNARLAEKSENKVTIVATATAQKHSEVLFIGDHAIVIVDAQELYFFLALNYIYLSQEPDRLRALFLSEVVECLVLYGQYAKAANLLNYLRRTDRTSSNLNPNVQLAARRIANLQSAFVITHERAHIVLRSTIETEEVKEHRVMLSALSEGMAELVNGDNEKLQRALQHFRKQPTQYEHALTQWTDDLPKITSGLNESMVDSLRFQMTMNAPMINFTANLEEEILCDMLAATALVRQFGGSQETLVYAVRAIYLAIVGTTSLKYVKSYARQIDKIALLDVWRHNDPELVIRLTFISNHIDGVLEALPLSDQVVSAARTELAQLRDRAVGWTNILDLEDQQRVIEVVSSASPDASEESVRGLMVDILLRGLN